MVRINRTKLAVEDLKSIAEYSARDSKKYARMQIKRITARISILKQNPDAGKVVPDVNEKNVRELVEGNTRSFMIITPLQIDILTVHH